MISPGLVTAAGLLSLQGYLDAFTAAKIISALFFAVTVFPLFYLHKRILDRRIAIVAVILFVFCSAMLRYAGSGLQETGKTFFFILSVYALVRSIDQRKWAFVMLLIFGISGLVLIRPEGFVIGALLFVYFIFYDIKGIGNKKNYEFPKKSIIALLMVFVICTPWMLYEYRTAGYFVPHVRVADALEQCLPEEIKALVKNPSPVLMPDVQISPEDNFNIYDFSSEKMMNQSLWDRMFRPVFKGFFRIYLLFAIIGAYLRIRRKEWLRLDTVLLSLVILHTMMMIFLPGGGWVLARYIIPAMPLVLGWSAIGVLMILDFLRVKLNGQRVITALVLLAGVLLIWDGMYDIRPTLNEVKKAKELNTLESALWLRENASIFLPANWARLEPTRDHYYNGRKPTVLTTNVYLTYLADAATVPPTYFKKNYSFDDLISVCKKKRVNFIILDPELKKICPELKSNQDVTNYFKPLFHASNPKYGLQILGFNANINQSSITPDTDK